MAAPSVIRTPDYSATLESSRIPRWARRWACWAMIAKASGSLGGAGWGNVRAAWDCDDRHLEQDARTFRIQAGAFFQRARLTGQRFAPSDAEEAAVLADLLRRTEKFSEAMRIASTSSSKNGTIRAVLSLQHRLAEQRDVSRHTVRDALVPVSAEN